MGTVVFLMLFGIISTVFGVVALLNETIHPPNYLFGTLGMTFGVIDLVSAYIAWPTKPRFPLFLFGFFLLPSVFAGYPSMFGWGNLILS